jgi:hypothetical protein
LLRGADDPDFSLAEVLEVFGEPLEVEDLVLIAADILADLVDDEDDVLLARRLADDVDHLLDAIVHQVDDIAAGCGERLIGAGQRRIEAVGDARENAIRHQLVVPVVGPGLAGLLPEQRLELGETCVLLQFALQRRDLQIAAVAGILEDLVV